MGHNIRFTELFNGYAYIQLTAHVLRSPSCTTMGTFQTTFRKKKKILLLESRRMFFVVVVLFPQNAPSQLSCISSEITKKFTKNSQNKIHISEKLLEYQLWIRT